MADIWPDLITAGLTAWGMVLAVHGGLTGVVACSAIAVRVRSRFRQPSNGPEPREATLRFVVIIPAHNEEASIARTVSSVRALRYPADRLEILVIADNCTDATTARAREADPQVRVYERTSPLKSKGHALEEVTTWLMGTPAPLMADAWVIIDADTSIHPDFLLHAHRAILKGTSWFQGYYGVADADRHWRTRLMAWAFGMFNGTWNMGIDGLGIGAAIRGNGFGGTIGALRRHPWKAHGLAEDLEFGWQLRLAGERIRFLPDAVVWADMPAQSANAASQRRRWEGGRSAVRRSFLRPILAGQLSLLRRALLLTDLTMPPLSSWAIRLGAFTVSAGLWTLLSQGSTAPLCIATVLLCVTGLYALSPFVLMGLPWRYLLAVCSAPRYVAWKLSVMAGGAPDRWVRTERERSP